MLRPEQRVTLPRPLLHLHATGINAFRFIFAETCKEVASKLEEVGRRDSHSSEPQEASGDDTAPPSPLASPAPPAEPDALGEVTALRDCPPASSSLLHAEGFEGALDRSCTSLPGSPVLHHADASLPVSPLSVSSSSSLDSSALRHD